MTHNIHVFDTPEATAQAIALKIMELAKAKNKLSLPFNIALSGGSTPKLLFQILANEFETKIPWHIVRLFWVDERCVPPTHSDSNFGMTYETLLKNVPIPDSNIFRMIGEADPQKEAIRYEELLYNQLIVKHNIPQFDLILLGMGDDGHTASIFPDNMDLLYSEKFVAVSVYPATSQKRITLTGTIINQAEEILFFVVGKSKAELIRQIINHRAEFKNYPTSYIHAEKKPAQFYLDNAAAEEL